MYNRHDMYRMWASAPTFAHVHPQCRQVKPHWLTLAGAAAIFARKPHANRRPIRKRLIPLGARFTRGESDGFDSHRPLHLPLECSPALAEDYRTGKFNGSNADRYAAQ